MTNVQKIQAAITRRREIFRATQSRVDRIAQNDEAREELSAAMGQRNAATEELLRLADAAGLKEVGSGSYSERAYIGSAGYLRISMSGVEMATFHPAAQLKRVHKREAIARKVEATHQRGGV